MHPAGMWAFSALLQIISAIVMAPILEAVRVDFLNKDEAHLTKHSLFVGALQTQRRVTFHLPDGSQESCSDSGLGDPEPSSTASTTQPLPLSFPQEEYYEQTSPNSRTEGDGNSDPESSEYWFFVFSPFGRRAKLICGSHVTIFGNCWGWRSLMWPSEHLFIPTYDCQSKDTASQTFF